MVRFAFRMGPDARHSNTAISMSRDFVQQSAATAEHVDNYSSYLLHINNQNFTRPCCRAAAASPFLM
jgi:hypothetical protein